MIRRPPRSTLFPTRRSSDLKRPIYFSTSTGNYADQLGLSPYLVGEGLVRRLVPRPVAVGGGVWRVEGRGVVDVPRSAALLFGVFPRGETPPPPPPPGWGGGASPQRPVRIRFPLPPPLQ